MKKIIRFLLDFVLILCIAAIVILGVKICERMDDDKSLDQTYQEIRKNRKNRQIDWKRLKEINPDIVGWVYVKGTNIDYPVVKGKSNREYLHKTFRKKYAYGGCIFIDSNCDINSSQNVIVYGHHMRNGSMFADLVKFRSTSFAKKHAIYFFTPQKCYQLNAFSAYAQKEIPSFPIEFVHPDQFEAFKQKVSSSSDIEAEYPKEAKKIFTFITCSYEANDYRTYVHAAEIGK